MAEKKKDELVTYAAPNIALGIVSIPVATLTGLPVEDFTQTGVKLVDERVKVTLPDANGVPTNYTLSLFIQRAPITDDERVKVAEVKANKTADRDAREQKEQQRLQREKKAAFDLGQESMVNAMSNINTLAHAVNNIKGLTKSA